MTEDLIGLISLSLTLLLLPAITIGVIRHAAEGDTGINSSNGIRTRHTKASPEAWTAGHTAALPVVKLLWPVALVGTVTAIVVQLAAGSPTGISIAFFALIVQIIVVLRATAAANHAARTATKN